MKPIRSELAHKVALRDLPGLCGNCKKSHHEKCTGIRRRNHGLPPLPCRCSKCKKRT